ncbi:MAG TPA: putative selenate ABC transporter substrate-binding protein, partial [Casimicrobiaceae bacterium]|nr:putative selenate ABC transporter substrate-binding protein [Casimicrobiaceae bacterium]
MSRPFRVVLLSGVLACAGLASAQNVLKVSAIPDEAPTELQRKFTPL